MNEMDNKWIGKNTIRPDGADKVTGRAEYGADTIMPGMIWGKVLRSPYPHATIKSINTKKAEKLDGVFSVATSADCVDFPVDTPVILGIQDIRWMARNVLAKEKVLFHGHPIAAVAARTEEIAEKEGHHPDICFGWGYAKVKIFTHAIKGLAESDFILAAKIDKIPNDENV